MREFKTHTHIISNWLVRKLNMAFCLGTHHFFPDTWSEYDVEVTKVHENRHTIQQAYLGLGIHPFVGLPLFLILYFLVPFPIGLAIFRVFFEYQADRDQTESFLEAGCFPTEESLQEFVDLQAKTISGRHYFFAAPPFIVRLFYNRIFKQLKSKL